MLSCSKTIIPGFQISGRNRSVNFQRTNYSLPSAAKRNRPYPRCAYFEEENFGSDSLGLPWSPLPKNKSGKFVRSKQRGQPTQSVEKVLWEQIRQRGTSGGGNNRPPRTGRGDGSGGSNWEFPSLDFEEIMQVVFASLAFIILYIAIVRGEELTKLAVDYVGYRSGRRCSNRLKRVMHNLEGFRRRLVGEATGDDDGYE